MQDVARVAGVSVSTVSAVVNEKGIIGQELTGRVHAAIKTLGYVPHPEARGLRTGRNRIIGMVIPDVTNPFYASVLRAAEREAMNRGYDMMVCDSLDQIELERRHLKALQARRVEGIVHAPSDSYEAREAALHTRVPIVFVDCIPMSPKVDCVATNNREATYEAMKYLIGLGHQRIATISRRAFQTTTIERLEGYGRAMSEAGLTVRKEYLQRDHPEIEGAYQCALRVMKSAEPPTAIFSLNNRCSLGTLRALRELAVPCPQRVSIIGFDDPDWSMVSSPPLTTIEQPTDEIGKRAIELLFRSIDPAGDRAAVEPEQILLKLSLHIRESTATPPN